MIKINVSNYKEVIDWWIDSDVEEKLIFLESKSDITRKDVVRYVFETHNQMVVTKQYSPFFYTVERGNKLENALF
jgi:hypothetical protein